MTTLPPLAPPSEPVPSKCAGPTGAGIEPNPCVEPGATPRCELCPDSPTYWRLTEGASS